MASQKLIHTLSIANKRKSSISNSSVIGSANRMHSVLGTFPARSVSAIKSTGVLLSLSRSIFEIHAIIDIQNLDKECPELPMLLDRILFKDSRAESAKSVKAPALAVIIEDGPTADRYHDSGAIDEAVEIVADRTFRAESAELVSFLSSTVGRPDSRYWVSSWSRSRYRKQLDESLAWYIPDVQHKIENRFKPNDPLLCKDYLLRNSKFLRVNREGFEAIFGECLPKHMRSECGASQKLYETDVLDRNMLHYFTLSFSRAKRIQLLVEQIRDPLYALGDEDLEEYKKSFNQQDLQGLTPFHYSAYHNNEPCCQALLKGRIVNTEINSQSVRLYSMLGQISWRGIVVSLHHSIMQR